MIWNEHYETMPIKERKQLQFERLRHILHFAYGKVPFYRRSFDRVGIKPSDFRELSDISRFPTTSKIDLRDNYPFGLFALPLGEIQRLHASSGTTGKPIVAGYSRNDIETWAEVMARTLACGDCTRNDVVQNGYGYGLFTGGLGVHYGAEKIGATVIPISGGNTKRQIMIMEDFGSTILTCTPSYALNIAEVAESMDVDIGKLKLKTGLFGAEPWTDEMRTNIEKRLNLSAIDIYGLTEVIGPGVSSECEVKNGLHIFDDHFYPEIIDPESLLPLQEGEMGELVFTSMTKEAFPIIRYRTRDISRLFFDPCPCGRTHCRMERVSGRTDDMLIIRGVNVFPTQIESVLLSLKETEPHYHIHVHREGTLDVLELWVEVGEHYFSDKIRELEALTKRIAHEIQSVVGLSCRIKLVEPKTIQRSEGKARRVTDHRKLQEE
jgi:phenylacetate-CoA ligase